MVVGDLNVNNSCDGTICRLFYSFILSIFIDWRVVDDDRLTGGQYYLTEKEICAGNRSRVTSSSDFRQSRVLPFLYISLAPFLFGISLFDGSSDVAAAGAGGRRLLNRSLTCIIKCVHQLSGRLSFILQCLTCRYISKSAVKDESRGPKFTSFPVRDDVSPKPISSSCRKEIRF